MEKTQKPFNTPWRRVAASLYRKPTDSKILGSAEVDVTELETFIQTKRKEGLKITLTHILLLASGRSIREFAPEFNCFVRRGNIVPKSSVDAGLSVLINNDSEMSAILVANTDKLSLEQLVENLNAEIQRVKQGGGNDGDAIKSKLAAIPWPMRSWLLRFLRTLTVHWGLKMPRLGLSADNFGSYMLSNIGSIGLDMGYPALFPSANLSVVLVFGNIFSKPGVVNNEVVPRRVMSLGAALDHRLVDAVQAGRLFRGIRHYLNNPHLLEVPG